MKVKIIASKPTTENCSGIEEYIGQIFDTYLNKNGKLMVKNNGIDDFVLFDGEYEEVKERQDDFMNIAKGYSGCTRKDFENLSKEQLIDILVNIAELKLERTDDWYPQEYFVPLDVLADTLRKRGV